MKISLGSRRQLILLATLGAVLVLALVRSGGNEPTAAPRAVAPGAAAGADLDGSSPTRGQARSGAKKLSADDVLFLDPHDFDSGGKSSEASSRNIFDFRPPTPTPAPTSTPAPTPAAACGDPRFLGPCAPPPPPSPTPTPRPPEISFKFIGSFGPKDQPIAVLVAGDKVVNARPGDVVFERFVVKKVGYESIDVGFVGPWTDVRRVPIAP